MKILLVSNFANCGGVESVIREISNIYIENHEVHFLYFKRECNIEFCDDVKIHFINNHSLVQKPSFKPKREIMRFLGKRTLMKKIQEINPDVVIAFKPFVGVAFAKLKGHFNFKLIASLHGSYSGDMQGYSVKKLAKDFDKVDMLTVLTDENKFFYEKYLKCKIIVAANPINLPTLEVEKENIICCVGRVDNDKRTDLFVKAVALCQDKLKDYRFIVAGDGSELDDMKRLAEQIGAKIEFVGRLSQIDTYMLYAKSKISVVCSENEGWCLVLQEAMFYKCIRIATRFKGGSLKVLLKDRINGYLSDFNEVDLSNKIVEATKCDKGLMTQQAYNDCLAINNNSYCLWKNILKD